jgi:hypothetical protein
MKDTAPAPAVDPSAPTTFDGVMRRGVSARRFKS